MPYINVDEAYILDNTGLQVDMATDIPFADAGFTDAQKAQARKNIAAGGSNPNLLDNWYFVGGGSQLGDGIFPINQRGQSSYTAAGNNGIDRWGGSYCNIVLNASGLTITSTGYTNNLYQFVPYKVWDGLVGKTVTLSFDVEAITGSWAIAAYNSAVGTISTTGITSVSFVVPSVADSNKFIGLAGQSGNVITLKAVKLELGTVSTLANDAPPDFGEELAKCKRRLRYVPLKRTPVILDGGYSVAVVTLTGIEMASFPTASLITAGTAYAYNPLTSATPTSASVIAFDYNTPTIQLGLNAALNGIGVVYDTVIQLSCEL